MVLRDLGLLFGSCESGQISMAELSCAKNAKNAKGKALFDLAFGRLFGGGTQRSSGFLRLRARRRARRLPFVQTELDLDEVGGVFTDFDVVFGGWFVAIGYISD